MKIDSGREGKHLEDLRWLARAGRVREVTKDHIFPLVANGIRVSQFKIDFTYINVATGGLRGDECKGYFHAKDRLRFLWFLAAYQEHFEEIRLQDKLTGAFHPVRISGGARPHLQGCFDGKWKRWVFETNKEKAKRKFRRARRFR